MEIHPDNGRSIGISKTGIGQIGEGGHSCPPPQNQNKLKQACYDFEALLISRMLKEMQKPIDEEEDGILKNSGNPYQGMFNWELSRMIAQTGSLGIAEAMMRQIGIDNPVEPKFVIASVAEQSHADEREPNIVNLENDEIRNTITYYAQQYNVDPDLISAIIICESDCDANSLSVKGAKGLMQLMDETAREVGVSNPFDPQQNIAGGTAYFRQMLDRYSGDTEKALAAYNAGPSMVDFHEGIPPFRETQNYVRRVISQFDKIRNRIVRHPTDNLLHRSR